MIQNTQEIKRTLFNYTKQEIFEVNLFFKLRTTIQQKTFFQNAGSQLCLRFSFKWQKDSTTPKRQHRWNHDCYLLMYISIVSYAEAGLLSPFSKCQKKHYTKIFASMWSRLLFPYVDAITRSRLLFPDVDAITNLYCFIHIHRGRRFGFFFFF